MVSHSGCIFVWRLSTFLQNRMVENLKKSGAEAHCVSNSYKRCERYALKLVSVVCMLMYTDFLPQKRLLLLALVC